jgi:hypothetical protein
MNHQHTKTVRRLPDGFFLFIGLITKKGEIFFSREKILVFLSNHFSGFLFI